MQIKVSESTKYRVSRNSSTKIIGRLEGLMHTMKTLEIWTAGEAVTVSSTVTGLGVAEELCEESVNRVGAGDMEFV